MAGALAERSVELLTEGDDHGAGVRWVQQRAKRGAQPRRFRKPTTRSVS
jgi:hypothetical protein